MLSAVEFGHGGVAQQAGPSACSSIEEKRESGLANNIGCFLIRTARLFKQNALYSGR